MGKSLLWTNFVTINIDFDTDHRLLTARLKTSKAKEYKKYVEKRQKPPVTLFPFQRDKKSVDESPNELLKSIMESISKEQKNTKERESWISEKNIQSIIIKN